MRAASHAVSWSIGVTKVIIISIIIGLGRTVSQTYSYYGYSYVTYSRVPYPSFVFDDLIIETKSFSISVASATKESYSFLSRYSEA